MPARLSIIVPVLDEAAIVEDALARLAPFRRRGCELIVADGGSLDGTAELAAPYSDHVIAARRGRAAQMNAGAAGASGDILLFLHVDSVLPLNADRLILEALNDARSHWGRFDISIEGRHALLPLIAWFMNRRSWLSGICTGDQGIFVRAATFAACGGFPPIELMEDIALSRALKRSSRPVCLRPRIVTSGRRWEHRGTLRTMLVMWRLRLAYFFGADPRRLAAVYDAARD